jgi:hypothetical protein
MALGNKKYVRLGSSLAYEIIKLDFIGCQDKFAERANPPRLSRLKLQQNLHHQKGRISIIFPTHLQPFLPPSPFRYIAVMASRRLALNLSQSLRNRAALNSISPLKRGFASPVQSNKNGVKTESTTLSNGLTVRQ